jgi:hypothetical protein
MCTLLLCNYCFACDVVARHEEGEIHRLSLLPPAPVFDANPLFDALLYADNTDISALTMFRSRGPGRHAPGVSQNAMPFSGFP